MKKASSDVLKALQVVLVVIGAEARPETARAIAIELANYPEDQVLKALARCKVECRFRLSLADVIERMEDGWPGPEEAWAMAPKSEADTVVVTQEIMSAIPFELLESDPIAARMAFKETYARLLAQARSEKREPYWFASLGHDVEGRIKPLEEAVRLGRLSNEHAQGFLPHYEPRGRVVLTTPTPVGKILEELRKPE